MPSEQINPSSNVPPGSSQSATPEGENEENKLEESKRRGASGLSWDEVEPKPGEKFNRVTEMGEAD